MDELVKCQVCQQQRKCLLLEVSVPIGDGYDCECHVTVCRSCFRRRSKDWVPLLDVRSSMT